MGATFQKVGTTSTVALTFATIDIISESSEELQPIPDALPIIVPLGGQENYNTTGVIKASADYTMMLTWKRGVILETTASDITEFPYVASPTQKWYVKKCTLSRKGGYLIRWDFKLELIKYN